MIKITCQNLLPCFPVQQNKKPREAWFKKHAEVQRRIIPIKGSRQWGLLECICKASIKREGVSLKASRVNLLPICLDPASKHWGNIYNADSYKELFIKFALLTVGRGLHAFSMTLYHATLAATVVTIAKGLMEKEPSKVVFKHVFESLIDIARIPYYDAILGATALQAVIGSLFRRTHLYTSRAFTDRVLNILYRGKRVNYDGSPCMRRIANITFFEIYPERQKLRKNVFYTDPSNPTLVAITNLA